MSEAAQAEANPAPDLSIRATPPSPRRLSRKVLMAGAVLAGGVIATALFLSFSERPEPAVRRPEAQAAAAGPPDTIRNAAREYEAGDLPAGALEPPRDLLWGDQTPPEHAVLEPRDEASLGEPPAARPAPASAEPDPQDIARASPIVFAPGHNAGEAGAAFNDDRLDTRLAPPRSRYELIAGSVIPAALVTELNSDLPGRAVAQVTANVFDSVTGEHLLIPQGSRLIGTYESDAAYGDRRLLLVWTRLILPNGWSISLRSMEGVDPTGAAGLSDRTDNHLDRLAGAVALSAIMSVVAENSQADDGDSLSQSVGDAAAAEAARTGSRIVDRELSVRPTLRIRAGGSVRVLVTRDIELRVYRTR